MKMRTLVCSALVAMLVASAIGCGSSNSTVTPVKDSTPQPAATPATGSDST
jgi:hypothetical protein